MPHRFVASPKFPSDIHIRELPNRMKSQYNNEPFSDVHEYRVNTSSSLCETSSTVVVQIFASAFVALLVGLTDGTEVEYLETA